MSTAGIVGKKVVTYSRTRRGRCSEIIQKSYCDMCNDCPMFFNILGS